MNYKEERMSYPDLCKAAHLLARYPFPENVSAVYRDLGYMAQYLEEGTYIVRLETGSQISHLVKAANPHEAIAKIAFDHAASYARLFDRRADNEQK